MPLSSFWNIKRPCSLLSGRNSKASLCEGIGLHWCTWNECTALLWRCWLKNRLKNNICCPGAAAAMFFKPHSAFSTKALLCSQGLRTYLTCLQSRPNSHYKHSVRFKIQITTKEASDLFSSWYSISSKNE